VEDECGGTGEVIGPQWGSNEQEAEGEQNDRRTKLRMDVWTTGRWVECVGSSVVACHLARRTGQ
jgi:hypothetical protein